MIPPVKYQVFVSSTYDDLREERDLVIKAVLELGHIPVGMEMFSAADEEQWKIIARTIDLCDYYLIIVAHRHGSLAGDISYTEKEYDYAVSKGIPVLGFVQSEPSAWPADRVEHANREKLEAFRGKVLNKPVSFWKTGEELSAKCLVALTKSFAAQPRPGWIRSNEMTMSAAAMEELSRLTAENAFLRQQLDSLREQQEEKRTHELAETLRILRGATEQMYIKWDGTDNFEKGPIASYSEAFFAIAPPMQGDASTDDLGVLLAANFNDGSGRKLSPYHPFPMNITEKILGNLSALGLVDPSTKKRSVKDTKNWWTLSDKGRELYRLHQVETLKRKAEKSAK